MSNKKDEILEQLLASIVNKCLYSERPYGSRIPTELRKQIHNVAFHRLPSGLFFYGVRTVENPRFYRDVVIAGAELDQNNECEETCYGADAKISKPCIILAHTNLQDRPDTVICQVGYQEGSEFHTVSNRKYIDGTSTIQYLHDRGYHNHQIELGKEELPGESGISEIIDETIRAIQDFEKLPDNLKQIFMEQLESFKTKIEAEKAMQPVPVTRILMDKFIQDLEKQDAIVFEGNKESRVQGQVADKTYVVDGKEYRVTCKLDDRKKSITELVDGKLSDESNLRIVIYSKDRSGEYDIDRCRIQMYHGEDGKNISFSERKGDDKFKDYEINANGAFMISDASVYHIDAPDESKVQLNSRELELATLDIATPDQIRQVYNRLRNIVRYQAVEGVEVVTDKYGYIQEKLDLTPIRLTGDDFEKAVPMSRIVEGVEAQLGKDKIITEGEKELGESK